MNYDRAQLRATALSVKDAWAQHARDDHARKVAQYKKSLTQWESKQKAETVAVLADALKKAKASQPFDTYMVRNAPTPPVAPDAFDCCSPTTQTIDSLVSLLDTIKDDGVSSSALSRSGFKDLSRLLRRPC